MNFLRKLFSGGPTRDKALYVYIKPKMCKEIVRVRIDKSNNLSLNDSADGYFMRKIVSGARCPFKPEIHIMFDSNRREIERSIENGEFVDEAAYLPFLEA